MPTSYLKELHLSSTDLSDAHILAMLEVARPPFFPKMQVMMLKENDIREKGLDAWLGTQMMDLIALYIDGNNVPQFLNILLRYPSRVKTIEVTSLEVYSLEEDLSPKAVHHVESIIMKTASFSEEDFSVLGSLEFINLEVSGLKLDNIYSCEVLRNLLAMNREAHKVINILENDQRGLNSSCLSGVEGYSTKTTVFEFVDSYGTAYLPEYIELVTNTSRSITYFVLANTQLPGLSLQRIFSRNFNAVEDLIISIVFAM